MEEMPQRGSDRSLFLEAPENLAPPLPSALPLLHRGGKRDPPGHREGEALGDGPGDSLCCRNLCRHLRRAAGSHLPPRQGRYPWQRRQALLGDGGTVTGDLSG